jgi:hypothetical protein
MIETKLKRSLQHGRRATLVGEAVCASTVKRNASLELALFEETDVRHKEEIVSPGVDFTVQSCRQRRIASSRPRFRHATPNAPGERPAFPNFTRKK